MAIWLIGIDDTDVIGSPGTGSLARAVADALASRAGRSLGVTRHQLLVHPDVPYTSHNSSNCVGLELADADADQLFGWACGFVAERAAQGADPGVCLAQADTLGCHAQVPTWACGVESTLKRELERGTPGMESTLRQELERGTPDPAGLLGCHAQVPTWACGVEDTLKQELERGTPASAVIGFGQRAQREVLDRAEAELTAAAAGCRLAGLAGTRGGIIGALAAVGLRAGGNDGRFLDLGTIRDLPDRARVQDILHAGVERVQSDGPGLPRAGDWVETFGWARPRLVGGQAVLIVERSNEDGVDWIVADRRRNRPNRVVP